MPKIEPMFLFDRQCEEALNVYKKAFNGEVVVMIRFSEAVDVNEFKLESEADKNLIYHAQMIIGSQRILLADNLFNSYISKGTSSMYPVMIFEDAKQVEQAFDILKEGAKVINPISSTSYSSCVTTFIDKFGIHWDMMVG